MGKRMKIENHKSSCQCLHTTPCDTRCSCVDPFSSFGCKRCCSYGSKEQQLKMAELLAKQSFPDRFFGMAKKPQTPKIGVGVIIRDKEERTLLLLRKGSHGEGLWSLPGGHMELGEDFFDTCEREVFEETGLIITSVNQFTFTNDIFEKEGLHYVTLFFDAHWDQNQLAVNKEPDKSEKLKWFDRYSLHEIPNVFPPLAKLLGKREANDYKD